MKVYISADMEGVSGIVHSDQTDSTHSEYQHFRKTMLAEVNAAVEGALKGGATEVLVNDSHGGMRNLIIEDLHPEAVLLSGTPKSYSMMAGIDSSYVAVFFTGYHARAGSSFANIDHTYYGPNTVQGVWLNGVEVGESGLNAALAGYFGVPVALLTGDQTACAQAKQLLGDDLETVVVKEAVGRVAAKNLHPTKVHALIRDAAERALASRKKRAPFTFKPPITLRLALARSSQVERCLLMPNIKQVAPRVIEFTHDDYAVLFNAFRGLLVLADIYV
ncbi:MAG: M55 family metallopeptidase [Chloroflexi bacterium]|nr:M55 family metallopeptidase [Chloroflexota bacterium]